MGDTKIEGYSLPMVRTKLDIERPLFSDKEIKTPEDVVDMLGNYMTELTYETQMLVCFDITMRPICVSLIGVGDCFSVPMPIRNILQTALLADAHHILLVHNHTGYISGTNGIKPSKEDVEVLDLLIKACRLLKVDVFDNLIIGRYKDEKTGKLTHAYYSMKEKHRKYWRKYDYTNYYGKSAKPGGVLVSSENQIEWEGSRHASWYWGIDVEKIKEYPSVTVYSESELADAVQFAKKGGLKENPYEDMGKEPVAKKETQEKKESEMQKRKPVKIPKEMAENPKYREYVKALEASGEIEVEI